MCGVCGVASVIYLFKGRPAADRWAVAAAEIAVLFGLIGLVTGPLWGRKAWGVWWQWDAQLTWRSCCELVFVAYLSYAGTAGPARSKLAAAVGLFGTAVVPFVYESVNIWRTVHPQDQRGADAARRHAGPFWFCVAAFLLLFIVLLPCA